MHLDDLDAERREVALDLRALVGVDALSARGEVLLVHFDRLAVAFELERAEAEVAEHLPAAEKLVRPLELHERLVVLRAVGILKEDDAGAECFAPLGVGRRVGRVRGDRQEKNGEGSTGERTHLGSSIVHASPNARKSPGDARRTRSGRA